jgi:hypothetical protein
MSSSLSLHRRRFAASICLILCGALASGCDRGAPAGGQPGAAAPANPAPAPAAQPGAAAAPAAAGPATPRGAAPVVPGDGPLIRFTTTTQDLGTITDTRVYPTSYPFTNAGNQPLIIESVKASCGCTVPTLAKYRYEPGESGQIDVVFDPKAMQGAKPKDITVISNSRDNPVTKLIFNVAIKPLLALQSRFMQLGIMKLGQGHTQEMWANYTDPDLTIVSTTVNKPYITARVVRDREPLAAPGGQPTYRVTIAVTVAPDAPWGTLQAARLTILLRGKVEEGVQPIDYDYEVYVQGSVYGEIHAESLSRITGRQATATSVVSLATMPPNLDYEGTVRLHRPSGEPFQIKSATLVKSPIPGMEVRVEPESPSAHQVIAFGNTGSYVGTIEATIAVETDVPGEERLELLVVGGVSPTAAAPGRGR